MARLRRDFPLGLACRTNPLSERTARGRATGLLMHYVSSFALWYPLRQTRKGSGHRQEVAHDCPYTPKR